MKERIATLLSWLLLAPLLLPLIYMDGMLYPYLAPKTLLLRGLGIILLAAFAYLLLSGTQLFWKRLVSVWTWIPGLLLVVAYGTSLFGADFYRSFWSTFERGDGLLTLSVCVVFFYITLIYAQAQHLKKIYTGAAWIGTIVAGYALLQWVQLVSGADMLFIESAQGRIGGTFGNAAFLAAYLGVTFFATIAVAPAYRGWWRIGAYTSAGMQVLVVLLTATRGTLLALLVAAFCALVYVALSNKNRYKTIARVGVVLLGITAGLFFMFRAQLAEVPFEPIKRVASISLTEGTVSSRLFVWQHLFAKGLERPLTGYGAEQIAPLFNQVYDPGLIVEQWFDRSHNAFLDYFVQFGVVGFALYCALIGGVIWQGWRRRAERFGWGLMLIGVVYAVQNFFVFDTAVTLWLVLMLYAASFTDKAVAPQMLRVPYKKYVAPAAGVALLILLVPVCIQPLRANWALADGYVYQISNVDRYLAAMEGGLALQTYADLEYGYQVYVLYTEQQLVQLRGVDRVKAHTFAQKVLQKNFERYPYDARTAVYLAHVIDTAPPDAGIDEVQLRTVLERAIALSPKQAQSHYLLSNIALRKGDAATTQQAKNAAYKEAIAILQAYAAAVPRFADPRFIIANIYLALQNKTEAAKWASEGLELYVGNPDVAKHAAKYYIAVEDWPHAALFLADVLGDTPTNYPVLYDYAKVVFLTGDKTKAGQIVDLLRQRSPGLVETDPTFLSALSQP